MPMLVVEEEEEEEVAVVLRERGEEREEVEAVAVVEVEVEEEVVEVEVGVSLDIPELLLVVVVVDFLLLLLLALSVVEVVEVLEDPFDDVLVTTAPPFPPPFFIPSDPIPGQPASRRGRGRRRARKLISLPRSSSSPAAAVGVVGQPSKKETTPSSVNGTLGSNETPTIAPNVDGSGHNAPNPSTHAA